MDDSTRASQSFGYSSWKQWWRRSPTTCCSKKILLLLVWQALLSFSWNMFFQNEVLSMPIAVNLGRISFILAPVAGWKI